MKWGEWEAGESLWESRTVEGLDLIARVRRRVDSKGGKVSWQWEVTNGNAALFKGVAQTEATAKYGACEEVLRVVERGVARLRADFVKEDAVAAVVAAAVRLAREDGVA